MLPASDAERQLQPASRKEEAYHVVELVEANERLELDGERRAADDASTTRELHKVDHILLPVADQQSVGRFESHSRLTG